MLILEMGVLPTQQPHSLINLCNQRQYLYLMKKALGGQKNEKNTLGF
jgi:hypothetical protein